MFMLILMYMIRKIDYIDQCMINILLSKMQHRNRHNKDPDMVRLNTLKKQDCIASTQAAKWAMMYFMEDYTDEIRNILIRLATKGCYPTFPGISLHDDDIRS
jgi:hypothetical protein